MKKIYKSVLFTIIAAAGFTACSDYEAPDITTESAISITGYETSFPASASTGSITFEAKGPVTVTSDNEWITATVDGNRIDIAVDQNNAFTGRSGSITVKCGNATDNISIIQSGIIFKYDDVSAINIDSDAWSQTYKADATLPVSVSSDSEWLKASLTDGILTIAADRNTKLQARTGIVTVSISNLTNEITINQGPLTFPLVKVTEISQNDDAKTYTYDFPTDIPVQFETESSWIHASFADEIVTITVDENNSGHMRSGTLSYSLEGAAGSLTVSQIEFAKDIAGAYMFAFTNASTGNLSYFNSTLSGTESKCTIEIPSLGFSIPVTYDKNNVSIRLAAGAYMGNYTLSSGTTYRVYTTLWDTTAGYLTWSSTASMDAKFEYVEEDGTGYTTADFLDNGSYPGYTVSAIRFEAFTSSTLSGDTRVGSLTSLIEPFLMKVHTNVGETASQSQASSPLIMNFKNAVPAKQPSASAIVKDNLMVR